MEEDGAQRKPETGPLSSGGSFTTVTSRRVAVERTLIADQPKVAMNRPSGLGLHCGDAGKQ